MVKPHMIISVVVHHCELRGYLKLRLHAFGLYEMIENLREPLSSLPSQLPETKACYRNYLVYIKVQTNKTII